MPAMLEVANLHVHYGGIAAVKDISFSVGQGETIALIGANGAGKTSTLKALARLLPKQDVHGSIRLAGEDVAALPAHRLIGKGLALVPEGRGVFARLTVAENLALGAYSRNDKREIAADLARVHSLLPRLEERGRQLAGTLSGGEQQMLALGRALMGRPRLLLLDEPSMGLAPMMVLKIFATIRTVASSGVSILLVEQNARLALETASRGYVMESGRITLGANSAELLADSRVRKAYLGK
jgi:branched-chain amino acid transport system ATP-binding protein